MMTRCTVSGELPVNEDEAPVPTDAKKNDGQHADHWVMCPTEMATIEKKRPVRLAYTHDKGCGARTTMPKAVAETFARDPGYYDSTFCCGCRKYLPVGKDGEFVWDGTDERVGT